jgi:uncharacterized LabA/DUF88 family protein
VAGRGPAERPALLLSERPLRTIAYVDAFNLYYGCLRRTPHKWLNLDALFQLIVPKHNVVAIKYFTALVSARPSDPQQPVRQETYLRALRTLPHAKVVLGHYLSNTTRMPLANPAPGGPRTVEVIKTEEKGSDVNLAVSMVHDGHRNLFDAALIVSNDSDLAGAARIVRHELGKVVGVLNPSKRRTSRSLAGIATFVKQIRTGSLAKSQFPNPLTDAQGQFHKPASW